MSRIEALKQLAEKVEAGEEYATMGHTALCRDAFPKPDDFDGSREAYAKSGAQMAILAWKNGSLDAAKALHEAVLPGHYFTIYGSSALVSSKNDDWEEIVAIKGNPARAWLLAILKALIAQEEQE